MTNVVQLAVVQAPTNAHAPRPVKVYYDGGGVGHCHTLRSAIAAATRHMMLRDTKKVTITYENVPIADILWSGNLITIKYVRRAWNLKF